MSRALGETSQLEAHRKRILLYMEIPPFLLCIHTLEIFMFGGYLA